MLAWLKAHILHNTVAGLRRPPTWRPLRGWLPVPAFAAVALPLGLESGVLRWEPVAPAWWPFLAIALFISPALLEELIFRGLLIPLAPGSRGRAALALGGSTLLYVLSHPLGAITTSPAAQPWFLDPVFLVIVTLLGLSCAYCYATTKSLWNAVLIHWLAVIIWVFSLGGYDVVLALEGHAWLSGKDVG